MTTPSVSMVTMTFLTDIDFSGRDRDGGIVPGLAALPNNRLLVIDYSSHKVKLLDVNTKKILSQLRFPTNPWDVAVIDPHQAAVTLPYEKKIVFFAVSDKLKKGRAITVSGDCTGLTYSEGKLLVTIDRQLEIMDLRGNVIKTIRDVDGRALFSNPYYVCVGNGGDIIYVSDADKCTVTCLTFDGVVRDVYMNEENNPWCTLRSSVEGICTDQRGNLYVCFNKAAVVAGRMSLEMPFIHVITSECGDGPEIEVKEDKMWRLVYSVCHCPDTNRLYVGTTQFTIKVYQLS